MDKEPGSKGQTKDLKRRKYLSGLHSNNNSLKMVYIYNAAGKVILLKTIKEVSRTI